MNKEDIGRLLLRIGLGSVFLWFGIDKFFKPVAWTKWIPEWFNAFLPVDQFTFIYALGAFETLIGLLVLIGFCTRIVAVLAGLSLFGIIASWGLNEIMIRDAGLMFLAFGMALLGSGKLSLDEKFAKTRQKRKRLRKSYA